MLVPSMTLEEVRKEFEKDFEIIYRKSKYVGQKLEKQLHPIKDRRHEELFDYFSKHKNNWIYKLDISKGSSIVSFMAYYYGTRGITGVTKFNDMNSFAYFSSHFFKRFKERTNLDVVMPEDIIRAYVMDNRDYATKKLEMVKPGVYKMFSVTQSGIILGIRNDNFNFSKMNTFISKSMLKGNQVEMEKSMSDQLEKYIEGALVLD